MSQFSSFDGYLFLSFKRADSGNDAAFIKIIPDLRFNISGRRENAMLDLILKNAVVLTMKGKGIGLIKDGAVGVKGSTIKYVDDSTTLTKLYNAKRTIDASGRILMPGLINAHCHSYYGTLTRGAPKQKMRKQPKAD